MQITEQQIVAMAPNPNAAVNGKKISQKNGFVKRLCSPDDTFYMGECQGSGKSNYVTSADYINEAAPVFRCSCPSRQFPCKHSLALLYEIAAGKEFETCEIPADILEKRAKKEAREVKKEEAPKKAKASKGTGTAAKTKKIKKQLEGMEMARQMADGLLKAGLGTMGGASLKNYRDLAKQLGDYYLPGPQLYMNRLILAMEAFQKDSDETHYKEAIQVLIRMYALLKKAEIYLKEKLEAGNLEDDDSILYEELGGIWQAERLNQLGLAKENARLVQLSFQVYYDEARKEYVDKGSWVDIDTGEIQVTLNYRPVKALKYIKQEDTIFDLVQVPRLTYYPGGMNRRIRMEGGKFEALNRDTLKAVAEKAHRDIGEAVKLVKNEIKNTLSEPYVILMLQYERIGMLPEGLVIEDKQGMRLLLADMRGQEETVEGLLQMPADLLNRPQVMAGAVYYDEGRKRICMQPYSIVTEEDIIRLLY